MAERCISRTFKFEEASVLSAIFPQVVALSASSTMLTALAGIVVLKENKHMTLKIVAAGLATLGVVLVQL